MHVCHRGSVALVRNANAMPLNPTRADRAHTGASPARCCQLAAIESLVGFRRRSTQRDRALLRSHFHFVPEIWHEVVPHANASSPVWRLRSGVPGRRTSILLRPSAGFKRSGRRRYRLPARISVLSILSKALVANMAKALTLAGASDSPYFEWKPWLKPVHVVAVRLPGFIAIPSTA
jgi:hypothetical protein